MMNPRWVEYSEGGDAESSADILLPSMVVPPSNLSPHSHPLQRYSRETHLKFLNSW